MKQSDKVDGRPSIQFYHRDAMNDVGLRMSSLSARGQWYESLWLMYDSPERGVLLKPNGKQIIPEELARILSAPLAEIKQNLSELETNGVYSTREDGAIYNRRMFRDEKQRQSKTEAEAKLKETRSEAGKRGGRPKQNLSKSKLNNPPSSSASASTSALLPEERAGRFVPPTPKMVYEYAQKVKYLIDGEAFCAWYESKGWMVGRNKMVSWRHAVVTAKKRRAWPGHEDPQGDLFQEPQAMDEQQYRAYCIERLKIEFVDWESWDEEAKEIRIKHRMGERYVLLDK